MRRCAFALALVGASVDGFFMPHVPVSLRQEAATSTSRPGFVSGWIIPAPWSVAQLGRHGLGSDVARGAAGRRALANACTGDANARPKVVRAAQQQETITGRSVDWVRGGAGGPKANRVTGKRMEAADGQPANPISGTSQRSEASSQEPNLMQLTGMIKRCGSVRDLALLVRSSPGTLSTLTY
ncbi:hypothetical protein T484DRAFT_1769112 [Baffinella frigidus]|nr:hypothetical protein T484DRAFT_1769112 [Cryptophyta sp. CCMP2293]